ncbi:hypothetical protein ACTXG6_18180 [Pseudonocardia sp. Cha107L01]|uniref:hypothetical protein n=1 Tax=Pseudonocardia sp. Cha107L01 TaxID=3457576 RepID=UPI00403E3AF2
MSRGRPPGRAVTAIAVFAAALGLTSCSGPDQPTVGPVAFGPAVEIGPAPAVPDDQDAYQRQLPVALDGTTAYLGGADGVRVVDTVSGQTTATVGPQHPASVAGPTGGPPVLTTINNIKVVLWPFFVQAAAPVYTGVAPAAGNDGSTPPGSAPPSGGADATPPSASDGPAPPGTGDRPVPAGSSDRAAPPSSDNSSMPLFGAAPTAAAAPNTGAPPPPAGGPTSTNSPAPTSGATNNPPLPTGRAVELASIATGDRAVTDVLVGLPDWASGAASRVSASVLGAAGSTVVLAVTDGLSHVVLAADVGTGRTVWTRDGFAAGALVGETVVGAEVDAPRGATEHISGLAVADGRTRWTQLHGYGLHVSPAGPTLVAAIGQQADSPTQPTFQLLNADTGAPVAKLTVPPIPSSRCIYDGVATTICFAPDARREGRAAVGVDARTGKQLWAAPDYSSSNAAGPLVTAAWRGMLYATGDGATTDVYRASNHASIRSAPGPVPMVVDDRTGVGLDANASHIVARQAVAPDS